MNIVEIYRCLRLASKCNLAQRRTFAAVGSAAKRLVAIRTVLENQQDVFGNQALVVEKSVSRALSSAASSSLAVLSEELQGQNLLYIVVLKFLLVMTCLGPCHQLDCFRELQSCLQMQKTKPYNKVVFQQMINILVPRLLNLRYTLSIIPTPGDAIDVSRS